MMVEETHLLQCFWSHFRLHFIILCEFPFLLLFYQIIFGTAAELLEMFWWGSLLYCSEVWRCPSDQRDDRQSGICILKLQ